MFTEADRTVLLKNYYTINEDNLSAYRFGVNIDLCKIVKTESGYKAIYDSETGNFVEENFIDIADALRFLETE